MATGDVISGATEKDPQARRRRVDRSKAVIIVGMPGAGKSNLGNKLIDHPTSDPFEEGDGTPGVTTRPQRSAWGDLVVIDTPGIPNTNPNKTLTYFDSVVDTIRREGSLSALIFLVHQESACPSEFGDYAVFLKQINHLPCAKLMVCRQAPLSRRNKKTEEEKRHGGARYVEQVLEDTGLSMPLVLLTDGYSSESFRQIDEIANFVRRSERVRVNVPSFRTSEELKGFMSRLADRASRLDALKQEVEELESSLWNRTLWMASQVVPLAYISVASVGAGFLWTGPYVKREQELSNELRSEIVDKSEEAHYGVVDEEGLRAAQGMLSYLVYIFRS